MSMKALKEGFENIAIEFNKLIRQPDVSEDITQTLSRLLGWYAAAKTWVELQTDQQGRLLVSLSSTPTNIGVISHPVVAFVAIRVLAANTARRAYVIRNTGNYTVGLGFLSTLTYATGIKLQPGKIISDDAYVGEIWAIGNLASVTLEIIEE